MKFKVEYKAGFGINSQNHAGFGPTIYIDEIVDYESDKDYFDFAEFFLKYSKSDDTYFQLELLENRELNEKEKLSKKKYLLLRDAMCEWAKQNASKNCENDDLEVETTIYD